MEKVLNALIVDDEESARKLLSKLLEDTGYFSEIRISHSVSSAQHELMTFSPDMIFLDIKMPGKDGFSFVTDFSTRSDRTGIVFVTAYEQHAIKAIKNNAFDYLLKPVNRKELKSCILRFVEKLKFLPDLTDRSVTITEPNEKITRIKVNTRTGTLFINPDTILYCKADGNYTTICTGEKQHLCSLNLGKIEELLPRNGFIRLGRSLIINFVYITMMDRKESSLTLIRERESVTIKIPRHHMKEIDNI